MSDDRETRTRSLAEEVQESLETVWLAGLGALSRAEEEGSRLFSNLVERGQAYEERARENLQQAKARVEARSREARQRAETTAGKVESRIDEMVSGALHRAGVPSRDEIANLTRRVEELTRAVEDLKGRDVS